MEGQHPQQRFLVPCAAPRRVIIIKSIIPRGINQIPFYQLPGLNFNRTTEQQIDVGDERREAIQSAEKMGVSVSSNPAEKMGPVVPCITDNPSGMNQFNNNIATPHPAAAASKTQTRRVSKTGATTSARKRKAKVLLQVSQPGDKSCNDSSANLIESGPLSVAKMRKRYPSATNPKNANVQYGGGERGSFESPSIIEKPVVNLVCSQDPKLRNASSGHIAWKSKSPVHRIIQRDMLMASQSSIFRKNIGIGIDQNLTKKGVYVFNVTVYEKDNKCSDFPPVKVQVTDDYPAEIPIFLDLQSIIQSITSKKIKQRFEVAVKIYRAKLGYLEESQLRLHKLILLWSGALKHALSLPQNFFNERTSKRRHFIDDLFH